MSWVIVNRVTGKAAFETFSNTKARTINRLSKKYKAIEAGIYLGQLNKKIREEAERMG